MKTTDFEAMEAAVKAWKDERKQERNEYTTSEEVCAFEMGWQAKKAFQIKQLKWKEVKTGYCAESAIGHIYEIGRKESGGWVVRLPIRNWITLMGPLSRAQQCAEEDYRERLGKWLEEV